MKNNHLKTLLFIAVILVSAASKSTAQSVEDIFNKEKPITWLGIDFSEARYLGEPGTVSPYEMKSLFPRINNLIVSEPKKYDINKAFNKNLVTPNLSIINDVNNSIDESKIMSFDYGDYNRMNAEMIQLLVNKYKFGEMQGIALVIIMEAMNKSRSEAAMWVTYVDASNNKVLHTARLTGKSGGFGFRNHWATSIQNVFKSVKSKQYKNWQKALGQGKK